jgi:hypothetical protein
VIPAEDRNFIDVIEIIAMSDKFCAGIESALMDVGPLKDDQDLRKKLGLCRNLIAYIRSMPDAGIANPIARDSLSRLITAMTWLAFYARPVTSYKVHRELIKAQALFNHLLNEQIPQSYSVSSNLERSS